ncbi:P-loop containing nucleoside triphosphate hydrolase protein [Tuber magnatum]|uniref:P-loop containing nucleoside triphosphate hydrolase protein n=1 Tax=Tuber magnatum TaxID=42249 RepID=A0A317SI65_9PEZI|nr:P-loop containing nucleoside triphosphate hydrolase protein [Tuber magnatum]
MAKRRGNGPAGNGHNNRPRQSNTSSDSGHTTRIPPTSPSGGDSRLASLTPNRGSFQVTPTHEAESTDSGNRASVSDNGSVEGWQTAPGPKTAIRRKFLPRNGGGHPRRDKHGLPALKIEGAPDDDDDEDNVSWGPATGGGAPTQARGVPKNPLVAMFEMESTENSPDGWRCCPEVPSVTELLRERVELPINVIDGPYSSIDDYLEAHYELLKEDAFAGLREAVCHMRQYPDAEDTNDLAVYDHVRILGLTFAPMGVCCKVSFSLNRAGKRVRWENSKRLLPGTLVCLSNDNFKTLKLATIAARPKAGLELPMPEVDLLFTEGETEFDSTETFIMVESRQGYFEAYKWTLKALQRMNGDNFLLHEHICFLNQNVPPPDYLKNSPTLNLSSLFPDVHDKESLEEVDILRDWPTTIQSTMDKTQLRALKTILTNRVAIVQGPPGTGKTTVSVEALKAMIKNMDRNDPPIVIACQTNHALEQEISFNSNRAGWITYEDDEQPTGVMSDWLGDSFTHIIVANNLSDEYEEADIEYEALKEMEAEFQTTLQADEFDDSLKGRWIPLAHRYRVQVPFMASEDELRRAMISRNVWEINDHIRPAMYQRLKLRVIAEVRKKFDEYNFMYQKLVRDLKIARLEKYAHILGSAKLVGLTTTGLSKNRSLLAAVQPRVLLIEEAAETLEGLVTAGCMPSIEHLILVGDHKQLRGHCAVSELAGAPFNLEISMFERLVNNKLPFDMLQKQRRMRPEIRELLTPIYQGLVEDHSCVLGRPGVPGMGDTHVFWYSHLNPDQMDSGTSRINTEEAAMIVGFIEHLVLNKTMPEKITVLTFYGGQKHEITKRVRRNNNLNACELRIATVDSYQGEENDVIILSLVRSNSQGSVGFLNVQNRICVALSRARLGFYIFGDAQMITRADKTWWEIGKILNTSPSRIGFAMPIVCQKHGKLEFIRESQDWVDIVGGCYQWCKEPLPCSHICRFRCHPFDHKDIRCLDQCLKRLVCGHQCHEDCYKPCHCPKCDESEVLSEERSDAPNPRASARPENIPGRLTPIQPTSSSLIDTSSGHDSAWNYQDIRNDEFNTRSRSAIAQRGRAESDASSSDKNQKFVDIRSSSLSGQPIAVNAQRSLGSRGGSVLPKPAAAIAAGGNNGIPVAQQASSIMEVRGPITERRMIGGNGPMATQRPTPAQQSPSSRASPRRPQGPRLGEQGFFNTSPASPSSRPSSYAKSLGKGRQQNGGPSPGTQQSETWSSVAGKPQPQTSKLPDSGANRYGGGYTRR